MKPTIIPDFEARGADRERVAFTQAIGSPLICLLMAVVVAVIGRVLGPKSGPDGRMGSGA
jgi:Na+/proline symporter